MIPILGAILFQVSALAPWVHISTS